MTVGVLTAFLLYLRMFFEPMQEISQFYNTFQSASSALEKLSGVLEEAPAVAEPAAPASRCRRPAARWSSTGSGSATSTDRPVLPGLDLVVPAGQTVALVGHHRGGQDHDRQADGALLRPRPPGGSRWTGSTCASSTTRPCAAHVVMVTQENFMFDGSVADNILFGRPGATRAEVEAAAARRRRARVHRRAARGLRHRRRQARRSALGRPAAAGGVRAGVPRRPGGADPGRGDLEPGRARASGWCSRRCARSSPTGPR